eukprot:COSAG01_NODE_12676_length_1701_cov_2.302747_1_plen_44_part_10
MFTRASNVQVACNRRKTSLRAESLSDRAGNTHSKTSHTGRHRRS